MCPDVSVTAHGPERTAAERASLGDTVGRSQTRREIHAGTSWTRLNRSYWGPSSRMVSRMLSVQGHCGSARATESHMILDARCRESAGRV